MLDVGRGGIGVRDGAEVVDGTSLAVEDFNVEVVVGVDFTVSARAGLPADVALVVSEVLGAPIGAFDVLVEGLLSNAALTGGGGIVVIVAFADAGVDGLTLSAVVVLGALLEMVPLFNAPLAELGTDNGGMTDDSFVDFAVTDCWLFWGPLMLVGDARFAVVELLLLLVALLVIVVLVAAAVAEIVALEDVEVIAEEVGCMNEVLVTAEAVVVCRRKRSGRVGWESTSVVVIAVVCC